MSEEDVRSASWSGSTAQRERPCWSGFAIAITSLLLLASPALLALGRFSLGSDLYSHVLLIPVISAYFGWSERKRLPEQSARSIPGAATAGTGALLFALAPLVLPGRTEADALAYPTAALVLAAGAAGFWFLGAAAMRHLAFSFTFLVFMIPMPSGIESLVESLLQETSTTAAAAFFWFSSTPVHREGLLFHLPNITLEVAPECSGIHSSLVLFIASLAAGKMFLRGLGARAILTLAVVPIAILRNGLRIVVIGELCARIGPEMIHSWVHRRGGPFFFVLSLIPFAILLAVLFRSERKRLARQTAQAKAAAQPKFPPLGET